MKKYLMIIVALALTSPLFGESGTVEMTTAQKIKEIEQQATDRQQQAKDLQQEAKDIEQAKTEARLVAFEHMLDRREFLYNQQKPSSPYKCLRPCCNGGINKEESKLSFMPSPKATKGAFCFKKPSTDK